MMSSRSILTATPVLCRPIRSRALSSRRYAQQAAAISAPPRPAAAGPASIVNPRLTPAASPSPHTTGQSSKAQQLAPTLLREAEEQRTGQIEKPGDADRRNFKLHWSVDFWRNRGYGEDVPESFSNGTVSRVSETIQDLFSKANSSGVFASPTSTAYWAYHLTRTGFLAVQGVSGLLATRAAATAEGNPDAAEKTKINQMFSSGILKPFAEPFTMYYQDYKNIEAGIYKLPWDMTTLRNKQYDPLYILRTAVTFAQEASNTLHRRFREKPEQVWMQSSMYPDYYLKTFHFQTDGWLSEKSASIYEASTETLFLGRQDAMQRQSLVPLHKFMRGRQADGSGTSLLEVACGTGRFATFVKDNYPRMDLTALDLSPYYLHEARDNIKNWHRLRQPKLAMGGVDGSGASFLQAAAEDIPQPDNSHDVVLSIYLFHELPPEIRRKAAKEMARVLKPGGMLILTDSNQLGDRLPMDSTMGQFQAFNEPWYGTFIAEDFGAMFQEVGLECDEKLIGSSTKVLSFRKPLTSKAD